MKKVFSFFGKLFSAIALMGVVLYCIGYFFAAKTKKIRDVFSGQSETPEEDEE